MNKTCETCIFWELKRKDQLYGMCLNEKNYRIRTEFGDGCNNHERISNSTIQMQSNVRG